MNKTYKKLHERGVDPKGNANFGGKNDQEFCFLNRGDKRVRITVEEIIHKGPLRKGDRILSKDDPQKYKFSVPNWEARIIDIQGDQLVYKWKSPASQPNWKLELVTYKDIVKENYASNWYRETKEEIDWEATFNIKTPTVRAVDLFLDDTPLVVGETIYWITLPNNLYQVVAINTKLKEFTVKQVGSNTNLNIQTFGKGAFAYLRRKSAVPISFDKTFPEEQATDLGTALTVGERVRLAGGEVVRTVLHIDKANRKIVIYSTGSNTYNEETCKKSVIRVSGPKIDWNKTFS
jgi:hypothetical protein